MFSYWMLVSFETSMAHAFDQETCIDLLCIIFVEIVEEESHYYKNKMDDIRDFKEVQPSHEKPTIPDIPDAYKIYKEQNTR